MPSTELQHDATAKSAAGATAASLTGEVVYLFAYDVAYELARGPLTHLLGQPLTDFVVDANKRLPKQSVFYRSRMVRLPPRERHGPQGPVSVRYVVKLLPIGAVSIAVHVPFTVPSLADLVAYHDLQWADGALHDEVRQLAERIRQDLTPALVRPAPHLVEDEAYTVFCLEAPLVTADDHRLPAERWLQAERRQIAALLTQETDADRLSPQEAEESTGRFLSYYEQDLVVIDWDAALLVDERSNFEDLLYLMELANLHLAELEAYDRLLDEALERAYRDLRLRPSRPRRDLLREFREIRIDLARSNDELSNITKFFGDWHLARVYENLAARFHLPDWHRTVNLKLKTLDDLYQILQQDQTNRWMLILEASIVVLFIIDLIVLAMGL